MIEKVLHPRNLYKSYRQVVSNKGASGVDGMSVKELQVYKDHFSDKISIDILSRKYVSSPILGVEIPKSNSN